MTRARGNLKQGPHGPEIWAVSSTETVFEGFEINSRRRASSSTGFEVFQSLGLLHELLHKNAQVHVIGLLEAQPAFPHPHKKTRATQTGISMASLRLFLLTREA